MISGQVGMIVALACAAVASALLTKRILLLAHRHQVMDLPGPRSSHSVATPRGGGLAIVVCFVTAFLVLTYFVAESPAWMPVSVVLIGAVIVAIIGAWDDLRSLSARKRVILHFLVGIATVVCLPPPQDGSLSILTFTLSVLYVVWMINLYNFMDGIDGIASAQAVCVGTFLGALAISRGHVGLMFGYLCLASASLGFLKHNWSPARIFMGDVGSGFLGYVFAALGLWASREGVFTIPVTLIAMGMFVVDATWTVLVRKARGQQATQAHRDHAYQHAVQKGVRPATLVIRSIAVNFLYLAPLACLAATYPAWGSTLVIVAYTPIWLWACAQRAGLSLEKAAS